MSEPTDRPSLPFRAWHRRGLLRWGRSRIYYCMPLLAGEGPKTDATAPERRWQLSFGRAVDLRLAIES